MKSPAKQGAAVIKVSYKCDDCGDLSHSQESLNAHREVCHSLDKSLEVTDAEFIEETDCVISKSEQIADACNCPKCGEHFLLLRPNNFNCALCQFQEVDQERFFVHLKGHYEPHDVLNVDPGSVIIEQVIDDTTDLSRGNSDGVLQDADNHLDVDDGPDDRDDPEYVPDNDDDNDDDWEAPNKKKRKYEVSGMSPPKSGSPKKNVNFVKPTSDRKLNDSEMPKSRIGIVWKQKKLSFVKNSATTSKVETAKSPISRKNGSVSDSSVQKTPASGTSVTIKSEPISDDEVDESEFRKPSPVTSTKWVRIQDIAYMGGPRNPLGRPMGTLTPKAASRPQKGPIPAKRTPPSGKPAGAVTTKTAPAKPKVMKPKPPPKPRERVVPVCGICKRVFSSNQALKMHMAIHTGEKNFSCEHCGKAFTQWSTCQQHIVSIHSGVKKYTCEYCGACFARSSSIISHRRIHTGEVLHRCNVCNKGFRAKSYLDRHRTLHTGEKRYKCEFCNKLFRTSTDMKRHRNSVHFGLGNISLTQAKEILQAKMEGFIRTPSQRPSNTVVQRFDEENSSNSSNDSEEVLRATTVIAGTDYEL